MYICLYIGIDFNARMSRDQAKNCQFDAAMLMILATPELVNAQPAGRWTALHQAAERGTVEVVRELIQQRADVNLVNRDGNRPQAPTRIMVGCF